MIENDQQFRYSVQSLAKQYSIFERDAAEPNYTEDLRQAVLESTASMIRKIEREVAVYLAAKYDLVAERMAAHETEREREFAPLQKAA